MKINANEGERFDTRHNGSGEAQMQQLMEAVGVSDLQTLINETVPAAIQLDKPLNLPAAKSEKRFLRDFKALMGNNKLYKSYIGMGYHDCSVPAVIQRNILENPGWYTAYTPYQAEIAQGRLEALINFQTMVSDLTGTELANASLLDEGTAAAEAMLMFYGMRKKDKKQANRFFVDAHVFPQTLEVLTTRAEPVGIELVVGNLQEADLTDPALFGILFQYPNNYGQVIDYTHLISSAHEYGLKVAAAADLLSLTLLTPPGEMGADAVVGTAQRFGVPMGYGGPHAAYFATRQEYKRFIPGRIIGVSVDAAGNKAYRMALQTREQHIKREKATSNICTAQVLLAVMSGMYAVYHGPKGLTSIAAKVHALTKLLEAGLKALGLAQQNTVYFDTLKVATTAQQLKAIRSQALVSGMNFRYFEDGNIGISLNETTQVDDVKQILQVFGAALPAGGNLPYDIDQESQAVAVAFPEALNRSSQFMTHTVFNTYHTEHEMLRYLKRLENKDLSLVHSMISLGSCTMKLNATSEMLPVTWPELSDIHPFVPVDQTEGYQKMFADLRVWLSEITGFADMSLQPNSGAQGEYTGLMVIRAYHASRGQSQRNVAIIPSSAHGTNPASAVMAGMKVVIVKCDELGNIDLDDLRSKAEAHSDNLAAFMVTYPSTHGVFEEDIRTMCDIIHQHGGQVYMDGANMNAQVGITSPALIGADVCHLNLHKTFCIPHGGGGPGMGPIGVVEHLVPFLPNHGYVPTSGNEGITAVSAAPWGSASILAISYAYIAMMGVKGLRKATELAILNANYIKERLNGAYPILYTGKNGRAAHEFIIDCRGFKNSGVEVEDIAKRLMDYGFHAPTVSFPVPGTMMIEPTESETKEELDRFCEALISIRHEIQEVADGLADPYNNVLKNAPHTAAVALEEEWKLPYTRQKAVFPLPWVRDNKFWPSVRRIDNAYGDRHLMCSCIPVEAYTEAEEADALQAV